MIAGALIPALPVFLVPALSGRSFVVVAISRMFIHREFVTAHHEPDFRPKMRFGTIFCLCGC
jgi:hypothetical protein